MYHLFLIVQKLAAIIELGFIIGILYSMFSYMRSRDR